MSTVCGCKLAASINGVDGGDGYSTFGEYNNLGNMSAHFVNRRCLPRLFKRRSKCPPSAIAGIEKTTEVLGISFHRRSK